MQRYTLCTNACMVDKFDIKFKFNAVVKLKYVRLLYSGKHWWEKILANLAN